MKTKKIKQKETEKKEENEDKKERKKFKQENVELDNAINEAKEIAERCIKCGMCKSLCPVFKILREEALSPRGKLVLMQDDTFDKIVYQCNLCKACEKKCPLNIKICDAMKKAREALVLDNKELESNKEMIKNIRETGNPFGKNPDEKGKLYCC